MKIIKKEKVYRIIFILLLISPLINFCLIKIKIMPLFLTIPIGVYMDDGSIDFYGIGYKILKCNTLGGDTSSHFGFYDMKYKCNTNIIKGKVRKYNESNNTYNIIKEINDHETIIKVEKIKENGAEYSEVISGYADFIINLSYKNIIELEQYSIYLKENSLKALIIYESDTERHNYILPEEDTKILKQLLFNE